MKIKKIITLLITLFIFNVIIFSKFSFATTYLLPTDGGRLVGQNQIIVLPKNNTRPLEYFAEKYQIGLSNMMEANSGIDPYLPKGGTALNIPKQLILPDTVHEGIIINNAEMRLYFYPKKSNTVIVLPIGIGQLGKDTPTNWITKVKNKKACPNWKPTSKMRKEYLSDGEKLPLVFPSGPDNPMGLYALYIGRLYAIHGTNVDFGIGLRVSHGCIRLRNKDIKFLFKNVPIGTRVQFINEPVKVTVEPNNSQYIEVHNPLSTNKDQIDKDQIVPIKFKSKFITFLARPGLNPSIIYHAIQNRSGMPIRLN